MTNLTVLFGYWFYSDYGDWWLARHTQSDDTGYIPSNYVVEDDARLETQESVFNASIHSRLLSYYRKPIIGILSEQFII